MFEISVIKDMKSMVSSILLLTFATKRKWSGFQVNTLKSNEKSCEWIVSINLFEMVFKFGVQENN